MRVFEMTAHVQEIKRSKGRTATAAAAYRACAVIACQREGEVHDYRHKSGLEANAIILPADAPAWALDRARLWNAAELREKNGPRGLNANAFRARAIVAREIMFGFPAELSAAGRLKVAHTVARHLIDAHGVAAEFSIHGPGKDGDQRNHHCHLLMTTRQMTPDGLGKKTREWDHGPAGSRTVTAFRAFLAGRMNAALADEGLAAVVHVEHRSHEARGTGTLPTRHQGPGKTNALRQRQARDRQSWEREVRSRQADRHGQERAGLAGGQQRDRAAMLSGLADRERRAVDEVRAALDRDNRAADPPSRGIGRLFQAVTGQAARAEVERQAQAVDRARVAEGRIGDLRAAFNAERQAHADGQAREARALDERHRGEDHQLGRAVSARIDRDRIAEVQQRRDEVRQPDRQHEQERRMQGPTPYR